MIGCSFVVNRLFFGEIGLLDSGMNVYGGENIELGIKVRESLPNLVLLVSSGNVFCFATSLAAMVLENVSISVTLVGTGDKPEQG